MNISPLDQEGFPTLSNLPFVMETLDMEIQCTGEMLLEAIQYLHSRNISSIAARRKK